MKPGRRCAKSNTRYRLTQATAFQSPARRHATVTAKAGSSLAWDSEAISTVNVSPEQLDASFLAANGAALDAKLSKFSGGDRDKLLAELGEIGVLNTDDKKLDAIINPPPPKAAEAK